MFLRKKPSNGTPLKLGREFTEKGISFFRIGDSSSGNWLDNPFGFLSQAPLVSYLAQLEEEGLAELSGSKLELPWESVYALLGNPQHESSIPLLDLPKYCDLVPSLHSHGGLTDSTFSIVLSGWHDSRGRPSGRTQRAGGVLSFDGGTWLLPEKTWRLAEAVADFSRSTSRNSDVNRKGWGAIRRLAVQANAKLDNFLSRTVVLSPERLTFQLKRADITGTKVVEVMPGFADAPADWLSAFDSFDSVRDRYDIPTEEGIVQVMLDPPVRRVLEEVKRMPGRRVSGKRAEAFIRNPYALLGEDAKETIDEKDFEQALDDAGIVFYRFTPKVLRDGGFVAGVGLVIEAATGICISGESSPFEDPDEIDEFINELTRKMNAGLQGCIWKGWELEILGDAEEHMATLKQASADWRKPRPAIRREDVYDLSQYSERVEGIGEEKPYYSPFIFKDGPVWFPDNVEIGLIYTPPGGDESIALSLDKEQFHALKQEAAQAEAEGRETIKLQGLPRELKVSDAKQLIESLEGALGEVKQGTFDPGKKEKKSVKRPGLVLKPNIAKSDYVEERKRQLTAAQDARPVIPKALKSDVQLLDHQMEGVARLQHYWSQTPAVCRGCLMADDMGLGKTVQLLTFIAGCLEADPNLPPVLIVAPVSLLENWEGEISKFFHKDFASVLTLYGENLSGHRLARADIDSRLVSDGLVSFLRPGWLGKAKIVLTTYETLRDLEFSFAAIRWSIMVCDEAQKIKNPNALVTRSAKKQKVGFRIACTGTPVENTLADLWSLFDYVQPGLLGALNEFGTSYRRPIEAKSDEERARVEELRSIVMPQIIRRTKKEVAKDLPKKTIVASCKNIPMSRHQRNLYAHAIATFKSQKAAPEVKAKFANHLGLLHYLKTVSADPRPIGQQANLGEDLNTYIQKSPKMAWLLQELEKIQKKSEKVIIFTEYRDIQRLLQKYIFDRFKIRADIINGDTAASGKATDSRQKRIDAFQKTKGFNGLILSPVAVGFGVNIQAANHVVHYTRTWNPAKEDQATDRAYRIGQEKEVFVYCPTTCAIDESTGDRMFSTFEEKLDALLERKRRLSEDMLNGAGDISIKDFGEIEGVDGTSIIEDRPVTADDLVYMGDETFEVFCAALWHKQGYSMTYRTQKSGDGGVDVVAIKGRNGALLQCKSSSVLGKMLGWEAVKDVVGGEAAYKDKHPGVSFKKIAVTNQFFNETAQAQAVANKVDLVEQTRILELLKENPISWLEVEQFLIQTMPKS